MATLRKCWGWIRCPVCRGFTQAKHLNCTHCKFKHRQKRK